MRTYTRPTDTFCPYPPDLFVYMYSMSPITDTVQYCTTNWSLVFLKIFPHCAVKKPSSQPQKTLALTDFLPLLS